LAYGPVRLRRGIRISFGDVWRTMIHDYRRAPCWA
jgi:hypothetical protein